MKLFDLENENNRKDIKDFFKNSLSSSNCNLLLGAGFSASLLEPLHDIENKLTKAKNSGDKEEIYAVEFEFFQKSILPLLDINKLNQTSSDRNKFIQNFIDIVFNRDTSTHHKVFNIFTTNYDNLIELSLEEKEIDYFDGFIGRINPIFSTKNYGKIVSKLSTINNKVTELVSVNLFKLHGSLYWKKADNFSETWIIYSDFKERIRKLQKVEKDNFISTYEQSFMIVNPNIEKFNDTVLLAEYYDQLRLFSNELEKINTILIAFGFSFHDEHIMQIINRVLENPTLTLVVFAFDKEAIQEFKRKFFQFKNVYILYNRNETLTLEAAANLFEEVYNETK